MESKSNLPTYRPSKPNKQPTKQCIQHPTDRPSTRPTDRPTDWPTLTNTSCPTRPDHMGSWFDRGCCSFVRLFPVKVVLLWWNVDVLVGWLADWLVCRCLILDLLCLCVFVLFFLLCHSCVCHFILSVSFSIFLTHTHTSRNTYKYKQRKSNHTIHKKNPTQAKLTHTQTLWSPLRRSRKCHSSLELDLSLRRVTQP